MPRVCYFTGKKTSFGNQVTHRGKAKYLGGVGTKITGINPRKFKANIQKVRAVVNGRVVRIKVSAKAIRNGMVVKPVEVVSRGEKGLVQPGIKCRGREYLRIIYGPEYTAERHLSRLRTRGLGHKRSLALREFALGIEALERFVRREPLRRVHECVFGVLALESEPVDPRL